MSKKQHLTGPGFVTVIFDIPFPISIPNGAYVVYDPQKEVACIELTLGEGSRAFFRNRPITGPTSFVDLQKAAQEQQRPRDDYSYLSVCVLFDGTKKATLNTHTGKDGGYIECKYYSEISVTFATDDLSMIDDDRQPFKRVTEIVNPFLDKYKLLNEDYRIRGISTEKNFYLGVIHVSPLSKEETLLQPREIIDLLHVPRKFYSKLGEGGNNILRTNSYELLGPKNSITGERLSDFKDFIQKAYEMPLYYDLIMEALWCLQKQQDYRLAIVHAETAFEVYVSRSLLKLMMNSGISESQASSTIEKNGDYWGIKKRLKKLDYWSKSYCTKTALLFHAFSGSTLYERWSLDLYEKRNAAMHAGANSFTYNEASIGIGLVKECIVFLENRAPTLSDKVQLNPSMSGFNQNAGEVMF